MQHNLTYHPTPYHTMSDHHIVSYQYTYCTVFTDSSSPLHYPHTSVLSHLFLSLSLSLSFLYRLGIWLYGYIKGMIGMEWMVTSSSCVTQYECVQIIWTYHAYIYPFSLRGNLTCRHFPSRVLLHTIYGCNAQHTADASFIRSYKRSQRYIVCMNEGM